MADALGKKQYRDIRFSGVPGTESRNFSISVSSEQPVARWWGTEILSHSKDAVQLQRLNDGAPVLLDHDRSKQIGVIERAYVKDAKLYTDIRFSKSTMAEEVYQDVIDGIRQNVSIGYQIDELLEDRSAETYTATRWTPFEISLTSVPADNTVGFGRSGGDVSGFYDPRDLIKRDSTMDPKEQGTDISVDVKDDLKPTEPVATPEDTRAADTKPAPSEEKIAEMVAAAIISERKRTNEIRAAARMAKLDDSVADKLINDGVALADAKDEIIRLWSAKVDASATGSGASPDQRTESASRARELGLKLLDQLGGK